MHPSILYEDIKSFGTPCTTYITRASKRGCRMVLFATFYYPTSKGMEEEKEEDPFYFTKTNLCLMVTRHELGALHLHHLEKKLLPCIHGQRGVG